MGIGATKSSNPANSFQKFFNQLLDPSVKTGGLQAPAPAAAASGAAPAAAPAAPQQGPLGASGFKMLAPPNPFAAARPSVTAANISPTDAARSPALMDRVAQDPSKDNKLAFAKKLMSEPYIDAADKMQMLKKLGGEGLGTAAKNPVSLAEAVNTAQSRMGQRGLDAMLKDPQVGRQLSEAIGRSGSTEAQAKLAGAIYKTDTQHSAYMLQDVFGSSNLAGRNAVVAEAKTPEARQMLDKMVRISDSNAMQHVASKELSPANRAVLATAVLENAPRYDSNASAGKVVSAAVGSLSPAAKNKFVDSLQGTGKLETFAKLTGDPASLEKVLPGLNPENAASLRQQYATLAAKAGSQLQVDNPDNIGLTQSDETVRGDSLNRARTQGTEASSTIGGELGIEVGIGPVTVGPKGSYSRTNSHSTSDTEERGSSVERGRGQEIDHGAREMFAAEQRRAAEVNVFAGAMAQIDQWAVQQGRPFAKEYKQTRELF